MSLQVDREKEINMLSLNKHPDAVGLRAASLPAIAGNAKGAAELPQQIAAEEAHRIEAHNAKIKRRQESIASWPVTSLSSKRQAVAQEEAADKQHREDQPQEK
jgi:hypothetical protein